MPIPQQTINLEGSPDDPVSIFIHPSKKIPTAYEFGKQFTFGVFAALSMIALGLLVFTAVYRAIWPSIDATDLDADVRSGLALHTDYGTGCQYLRTPGGALYPRMDATGKQLCNGERN